MSGPEAISKALGHENSPLPFCWTKTYLPLVSCLLMVGLAATQGAEEQLQRQVWGCGYCEQCSIQQITLFYSPCGVPEAPCQQG